MIKTAILYLFTLFVMTFAGTITSAQTCVSLTSSTAYTENFDSLASTGTSSLVPNGWAFVETGTSTRVDQMYTANTGSSNISDTYSYGASSVGERAFGSLTSGTLASTKGACFINNRSDSGTIQSITVSYTGEQWRQGDSTDDMLVFEYSTDATSLTTGTWTQVSTLNFASPNTTSANGALDGNASGNRSTIAASFDITRTVGQTFRIRWLDPDATGTDDGLAIDDFSLTNSLAPTAAPVAVGGRVTHPNGRGVFRARITILDNEGNVRTAYTNPFGFYRFTDVPAGIDYIFSISHIRYQFTQPTQVHFIGEETDGVNFVVLSGQNKVKPK